VVIRGESRYYNKGLITCIQPGASAPGFLISTSHILSAYHREKTGYIQ